MLRSLPHFFFFKEGAPFVVIPAYCTTNPRLSYRAGNVIFGGAGGHFHENFMRML